MTAAQEPNIPLEEQIKLIESLLYRSPIYCANLEYDEANAIISSLKRLRKRDEDAERYLCLRDSKNAYPLFFIAQRAPGNIVVQFTGDLADMNIDAARKEPNP